MSRIHHSAVAFRYLALDTKRLSGALLARPRISDQTPDGRIPMIELVIAVSCFVIGFCATDFVCYRIRTGSWR